MARPVLVPLSDHGALDLSDDTRIPLVAQLRLVRDKHHHRDLTAVLDIEPDIRDPQHWRTVGVRCVDGWRGSTQREQLGVVIAPSSPPGGWHRIGIVHQRRTVGSPDCGRRALSRRTCSLRSRLSSAARSSIVGSSGRVSRMVGVASRVVISSQCNRPRLAERHRRPRTPARCTRCATFALHRGRRRRACKPRLSLSRSPSGCNRPGRIPPRGLWDVRHLWAVMFGTWQVGPFRVTASWCP